ncbi:TPA: DUF1642 domain-containing protein [Enterococcus faecium]
MNKQELIERYKIKYAEEPKDWKHPSVNASRQDLFANFIRDLEQLDEPQKPVVPQSIAVLIEKYKEDDVQLTDILVCFKDWSESEEGDYRDEISWVVANPETFMRAWLDGYEVEKEPLYYVKIPSLAYDMFLVKGEDGELIVFQNTSCGTKFTEVEIKAIDERFWAFAVPVDEVVEE